MLMSSKQEEDMAQQNALQRDEMQLGRYRLLKRVGRGGMGEVWLAEDPHLHRQVAIKMLPPQTQYNEEDAALFEREAQMVAALNHPHVLPVHDYGEQHLPNGQVINYLVMPYISGGSLADLVERHKATGDGFHYREVLAYLMQAAEAIDYAHAQGMIHRDIKPANMMLRSEGSLLLADFGIALMVAHDDASAASGAMIGTPLYIAPEQAQGKPTAASDLYSLAVIAFLFVTGRPPFEATTAYATIIQHIVQAPPSPRQWHPDLPIECEAVLLRGLAKKPEERYPSACEFVAALMRSLGAEDMLPASLQPPSSPSSPSSPSPATPGQDSPQQLLTRRNVLIGAAASVVVLGGAAGDAWALSRNFRSSRSSRSSAPRQVARTSSGIEKPAMVLRDLKAPPDALLWQPGKHILTTTCSAEGTVKLWDIDAFRLQNLSEYQSTYSQSVAFASQAAWSGDGKYLAMLNSSTSDLENIDLYLNIYSSDLKSQLPGFEKGILIPAIPINGINWLADRYVIATWDDNSSIDSIHLGMWDIKRPRLRPQPLQIKAIAAVYDSRSSQDYIPENRQSLAISPDASRVALAFYDHISLGKPEIVGQRVVWRQDQPNRLIGQYNTVQGVVWSGDGKRLCSVAETIDGLSYVLGWDLAHQPGDQLRFGIPQKAAAFTCLAACPGAGKQMFAAGTQDGKIYIWDGQMRKLPVRTLVDPSIQQRVQMLAWSSDGQWLAASYADNDVTILIWKI
jgi:serine/threonine protein kinase